MPIGQIAYLALVIVAFVAFGLVLAGAGWYQSAEADEDIPEANGLVGPKPALKEAPITGARDLAA